MWEMMKNEGWSRKEIMGTGVTAERDNKWQERIRENNEKQAETMSMKKINDKSMSNKITPSNIYK